jgi:C1A family cysteine protease
MIYSYGWKPDLPDKRDLVYKSTGVITPRVDLRSQCPPIYNQLQLGSCTANAIAGAIEFDFGKEKHLDFIPSRLFIYFNERKIENSIDSDSGAMIRDGIKTVASDGVCDERLWPYNIKKFKKEPCKKCYTLAEQDIVEKYERLLTIDDYKNALSEGYPFIFGFTVYESFESIDVANTGIVPMPKADERVLGGHAVLGVGLDDNKGYFIVRNSWGPTWGDRGYFYLPYDYFTPTLTDDFWVVYTVS